MRQPYDLVLVEWLDSGRSFEWVPLEELEDPAPVVCYSVGWLVKKTKQAVLIVSHLSHPDGSAIHQGCGGMAIPTRSISSIIKLKSARAKVAVSGRSTR